MKEGGKQNPVIPVCVFVIERILCASKVRYNSTNRETLDVLLSEVGSDELPSEYETLTAELSSHFKGKLSDLQEAYKRQDITFLAHKCGWEPQAVELTALADQISRHSGESVIPLEIFYALFHAGLPSNGESPDYGPR